MTDQVRSTGNSARAWLRDVTADVHEALHHLPDFEALLEGRLPLDRYRDMLAGLHAYHGAALPVCHAADVALGLHPAGATSRERLDRLGEDLGALGARPMSSDPREPHADRAWNIGFAYVVRGSAVGGQLLHKALAGLLPGEMPGRSFFALSAPHRADWRRFCALLDAGLDADELPGAGHGAHAAFETFRAAMDRPLTTGRC